MPIAFPLGMNLCKIFPIHFSMSPSIVTVEVLFRKPYCWYFMDVAFLPYRGDKTHRVDSHRGSKGEWFNMPDDCSYRETL